MIPPAQSVDPTKFPHGLSTIADAAHAGSSRTQFIVWTEPERTAATAYLGPLPWSRGTRNRSFTNFTIHEFDVHRSSYLLLDLGNPQAQQYMTAYLSEAVKTFRLDVLRMDFNIDPAASWSLKDRQLAGTTDNAVGLAEVAHVEGLYAMWKTVIDENPDVLLDNCASGGRRIDLETATLSVPLWQSDLAGNRGDVAESWQSQSMGLSCFLPVHSGGCPRFDSHTTSGPTGEPGLTTAVEPYVWRSCGTVGKAIAWTPAMWADLAANKTLASGVRTAIAETQRMRELVSAVDAKYWPLTAVSPSAPWAAYEHLAANASTGFALVFRRPSELPVGGRLMRLVTNRSSFSWSLTAAAGTGYFKGTYYFTAGSKAAATQDACQSVCSADSKCSGFTFVPHGGPPCALYSAIIGPFAQTKAKVTQLAKVYDCGLPNCAFGFNAGSGERHPLPTKAGSPFTVVCGSSAAATFVPNCATPTECTALSEARDGAAGCPPYPDSGGGGSNVFQLQLRGVRDESSYSVELYHDSYEQTGSKTMTGTELKNMTVSMSQRSVLLLWFTA